MIKSKQEKQAEFETLDKMQQDTYMAVREFRGNHEFGMKASRRYSLAEAERVINFGIKNEMNITQAFIFNIRLTELTVKERELYHRIMKKYSMDIGDEYLAIQMVEDYDTELLGKLTKELEPSGMDIVEFSKRVLASVRPKIEVVEASEDVGYTESVPF